MDWEQKQEQKIQNRIKHKSKKEHNRFYKSKYDDDEHLYHRFKKIKSKRMKDDDE